MPTDGTRFEGTIGRYYTESTPWWPEPVRPPDGAPNVLVILLDDVGFAQLGCFGSGLDTPNLDGLAARGLRFTNFHTTALCSPTRSCVLTGRNHHSNGMGRIIELATGFPGYDAHIPRANGFLGEMLLPHGYASWAVGKWHLTPDHECHNGATRVRWPLGRGFERFFGFFPGETHQFSPALARDNHLTTPPRTYEEGYHLTEDMADETIRLVRDLRHADPDKPFFCYFTPGACHSPHQAPPAWIERYRGHFDDGWDAWRDAILARQIETGVLPAGTELSPRPDWVPAWDSLSEGTRRVYARYMEAFAGFLAHTDHQIGRVLDALEESGDLENTLVIACSDNGASSEGGPVGSLNDLRAWNGVPRTVDEALERLDEIGGPRIHNNYPWGWTIAGNTPFRRWKRETHEGGVADPLIVSWPRGIAARGEVRRQYVHAIDIVPTVLEAVGIEAPAEIDGVAQRPVEGISFAYALDDADAPERHETQYYEMLGCRAIYHRGWKAVTYHQIQDTSVDFDDDRWELYHVAEDPSECHDLAGQRPELLRELVERWWGEAGRYQVLPVDNRPFSAWVHGRPDHVPDRDRYVYRPHTSMVPEEVAVDVRQRTHTVTASVGIPEGGAEGVLLAQGSVLGGWSFHLLGDRLCYVHNRSGLSEDRLEAPVDLAAGRHELGFRYERDPEWGGTARLLVDGAEVAATEIPAFTWHLWSLTGHGLQCGRLDTIPPTDDYALPFAFTGDLQQVVVEVEGGSFVDPESELGIALGRQ